VLGLKSKVDSLMNSLKYGRTYSLGISVIPTMNQGTLRFYMQKWGLPPSTPGQQHNLPQAISNLGAIYFDVEDLAHIKAWVNGLDLEE
jgi:hypothetical protein